VQNLDAESRMVVVRVEGLKAAFGIFREIRGGIADSRARVVPQAGSRSFRLGPKALLRRGGNLQA